MTFDEIERSNYDGVPTRLYEFALGDTARWRYANGVQDVTLRGDIYTAVTASDSGIVQSGDVQNDDFTITLPADAEITRLFIGTPPSLSIYVIARDINRGAPDAPVVWAGTVKNGKRTSLGAYEIVCKTLTASLNRLGVRLGWGRGCPHALYDRNCKVNKTLFATAVQITGLTGSSFTAPVASLGNNYLAGGFLEFDLLPGVKETRAIEAHVGNQVYLLGASDGLKVDDWVTVYPGCDLTTPTCEGKFNNLSNYGGYPMMPTKSPFDGDPVF